MQRAAEDFPAIAARLKELEAAKAPPPAPAASCSTAEAAKRNADHQATIDAYLGMASW